MSVHLVFGEGPFGSWRLPAGYDLESLRSDLEEAFAKGTFAWVSVELHDDPTARGQLIINGRIVPFAAIVDQPDQTSAPTA